MSQSKELLLLKLCYTYRYVIGTYSMRKSSIAFLINVHASCKWTSFKTIRFIVEKETILSGFLENSVSIYILQLRRNDSGS